MPKKLSIEENKEEFIKMYIERPIKEVMERFNCKAPAVNDYAKKYGIRKQQGKLPERKLIFDDLNT